MSNGPIVPIQVIFRPDADETIEARPERALIDWGKKERAQWRLASSDQSATLHAIEFEDDPPKGPFGRHERDPDDPTVWNGSECDRVTKTFKYDIVVKDGDGNEIRLDPLLTTGNPPD